MFSLWYVTACWQIHGKWEIFGFLYIKTFLALAFEINKIRDEIFFLFDDVG